MRKFLFLILGLTVFASCSKDDINEDFSAPAATQSDVYGEVTENSTEATLSLDINQDGDLADAVVRVNKTKNGSVTSTGDWTISNDINPDFFGNSNGFWVLDTGEYYLGFLIAGKGSNVDITTIAVNYSQTCSLILDTNLGVAPVVSNHSETTLTLTYNNVNGALLGYDFNVDIVVSYERTGNEIIFSEKYYNGSTLVDSLIGNYIDNGVQAGITVSQLPDCGKRARVFNTFNEYVKFGN